MKASEHLVRDLFAEALEISDPNQRAAFLNRACGVDTPLRHKIEALLQAEAEVGNFLPDRPATTASHSALEGIIDAGSSFGRLQSALVSEKPGDRIGSYELLEKIGEGGCGLVYLAQQETPVRRQVALKVIKLGMDTRQVIARFEAERQALALMDHPNIAMVLDAGATDAGRPYFVMELVRGSKITDYCDRHQLTTRERLELFIPICQAVQHAHQKGIIHRDLKPSNVLVAVNDGGPVLKVIDFGIAKATEGRLTDQTLFTTFEQFLGTPAYMSPEQAALTSGDIDTRSDIYSLGVLLYELLTGTTPFDTKTLLALGVDELRRVIRDQSPARPSTRLTEKLAAADVGRRMAGQDEPSAASRRRLHEVRGDLDWIVMKCLEKDRARRYETASGLAADLRRHLNNEPVIARPPSRLYEFQKTVRRHMWGFAATAAVIVVLVAGVVASTFEAVRATRAEQQSEVELYTSDMNLCHEEWLDGKLANARALLNAHIPRPGQPDLRGFEWRYLWNLCRDESTRTIEIASDGDPVRRVVTTPGHGLVVAVGEKTIRLLDPSTGREMTRLAYPNLADGGAGPLVALSAGATNLLAEHRAGGVVDLWDLASRRLVTSFRPFTNNIGAMALSPDGNYLAVADQDRLGYYGSALEVWDISLRPQPPSLVWVHGVDSAAVSAMTFSPNGQFLVNSKCSSGGESEANLIESWESKTGRGLATITNASIGDINALAISPDGTLLASAGAEGRISVWDFANSALKFFLDGHSTVGSLVFSADGAHLFSGGADAMIRRWDIPAKSQSGLWRLPQAGELSIALTPDGKSLVSAQWGEIKFWDAQPREEAASIKVRQGWSWPTIAPDGKEVVVADPDDLNGSHGADVWDLASGRLLCNLAPKSMVAKGVAFSPDGSLLAVTSFWKDGLVALYDTAALKKGFWPVNPFGYLTNGFESICPRFSHDGKILAIAGMSFAPYAPKEPSGATNRLAFWEVGSWKRLDFLPQAGKGATEWEAAGSVDISDDGRLLAVGTRDGRVRLWDTKKQQILNASQDFNEYDHWPVVVRFSSDFHWLASFQMGEPKVELWDLADPHHPRPRWLGKGETIGMECAIFAPDDRSLITGSDDGLIKFWNLQTRRVALTLRHGRGPGCWLSLSPDGTCLVSKDANDTVKIWKAPSLADIDRERLGP